VAVATAAVTSGQANATAAAAAAVCARPVTVFVPGGENDGDRGSGTIYMAPNQTLEDAIAQEMEVGAAWNQARLRRIRAGDLLQPMCPTPLWHVHQQNAEGCWTITGH